MGVNKTVVTKWLEDSGFTKWAVCRNGYNTEDQYIDEDGINIWINWESGNFRFAWVIPHTVFKIVTNFYGRLQFMASSEKLKKLIEEVREESSVAVQFSEKLTKEYSEDLDNAIKELEVIMDSIGESSIEDIPDTQLEYYCVKIPALMYRAGVKLEEFGLMADISSSQKRQEYNEAMLKVSGTVQERKARVEQLTEDKALVEVIYKRTYNSLRGKLDMAEKMYSGLKKALSKRISESDLDRFSKDSYVRRNEED